jgi:hypothetical protein
LDLTIGNEGYKRQFGVKESYLYYHDHALSSLGWTAVAIRGTKRFAGAQIRKLPKKYWPKRLKERLSD